MIYKTKLKKSYAKLKAREIVPSTTNATSTPPQVRTMEPTVEKNHHDQQAISNFKEEDSSSLNQKNQLILNHAQRRAKKPGYFEREVAIAEKNKALFEAKRLESERRAAERERRLKDRERFQRAMAKVRSGGKNGQRRLGRESVLLLEKVKKLVDST